VGGVVGVETLIGFLVVMMCEVAFSESVSSIRITGQEIEKCDYSDWMLDLV
jgi:hypothetical protein